MTPPWRWLAVAAAAVVVVAAVGAHVQARRELAEVDDVLDARRRDLAATAAATAAAAAGVEAALASLDEVAPDLRAAQAELVAERRAAAEADAALAAAQVKVAEAQAELDAATVTGDLRSRQVEALRQCLRGVTRVLNAVAVDDVATVVDGLEQVAPVCADAQTTGLASP